MTPEPTNQFISLSRRRALDHAAQLIHAAWRSFDEARPEQPDVAEQVQKLLSLPLPEHGVDAVDALDDADLILDQSLSQSRPRFFAFVGSSGLEMGVLADALAASHDVNLAVYAGAANLVERQALHWIADLVGFSGKFGTFTSGGMLSNLTALTAAREHALPDSRTHGIRQSVAIYTSRDAHSSIARAVEILGFGTNALRDIPIDTNRRMISAELEKAISADVANNVTPIAIVASAGTTLAGAVDPLDEIADIAEKHNIWLHIDGAYGAPAAAVRAKSKLFVGLARADSLTIDAHKWLYLPKPCGVLLVQDINKLKAAFTHDASYIVDDDEFVNPVEWTLEYSRPLRALKVWLALRTYGAAQFRTAIESNIEQASLCTKLVNQSPTLNLLVQPQLSTVLFRRLSALGNHNEHNVALAKTLQEDGRVYIAAANVDGQNCLRVCFVNFRTTKEDVHALVQIVEEIGTHLESQQGTL